MTIKEIAKIAQVSVSTVSKIMNNKDASISTETRERVLAVAREYHYTPYATAIRPAAKAWVIGVVLCSSDSMDVTLNGILEAAQNKGYSINLFDSRNDAENELKNISACCAKHLDGIIWEPICEESLLLKERLNAAKIPFQILNYQTEDGMFIDYAPLSYSACECLIQQQHSRIGCLVMEGQRTEGIITGYRSSLFDHHLLFDERNVFTEVGADLLYRIKNHTITGLICSHFCMAFQLMKTLSSLGYRIPYDISIISMRTDLRDEIHVPELSTFFIPKKEFGIHVCNNFIDMIENTGYISTNFSLDSELSSLCSVGKPYEKTRQQLLVIGGINIDTYLNVDQFPSVRNTIRSSTSSTYPGGKAMNQAVGIAKLGLPVSIIGNVGNDIQSDLIYSSLNHYEIPTQGISRNGDSETGHAYIFLGAEGVSMISILDGANADFLPFHIENHEDMFQNTAYCLIQTEIPMNTVQAACKTAQLHGVRTIVKPSACGVIPDELLKDIDILVPNSIELFDICTDGETMEEKSQILLNKGVKCVIVTLGSHGIFKLDGDGEHYYPAVIFSCVDTTGASDAFISAFSAYLIQGYSLDAAIQIGSVAAAFSITREGVTPSLVNKTTLESYLYQNFPELLK